VTSRLPSTLIDLAAGRAPRTAEFDAEHLPLATDHRMTGLLWTWGREHLSDRELKTWLLMHDLGVGANQADVWNVLESVVARLDEVGIEFATIKGVTAEARWYQRRGERPCSDVDLLLAPHQLDQAAEAVAALQPDHPWIPHLNALVASRRVQAVTLRVDDMDVDLHFDLLKLGIPTRGAAEIWSRTIAYDLPGGGAVRVLDDTTALLHFLVHLNKDRFQRLLGYADIQRIVAGGEVDWDLLQREARREGIEVSVFRTLGTVLGELSVPFPAELSHPRGLRSLLWSYLWRLSIRLRGSEGRLRFRMRQNWIAILARGRGREALWWWLREFWPPEAAVDLRYQGVQGPYVWKLFCGRFEAALAHHRRLAALRRQRAAAETPDGEWSA
jgi:hypothetical protein